jgi:prevent-host-death family protein
VKALTAKDAKRGFGQLIDLARSELVAVAKHGRPVVVVTEVEEYKRPKGPDVPSERQGGRRNSNYGPQKIGTLLLPLVQL